MRTKLQKEILDKCLSGQFYLKTDFGRSYLTVDTEERKQHWSWSLDHESEYENISELIDYQGPNEFTTYIHVNVLGLMFTVLIGNFNRHIMTTYDFFDNLCDRRGLNDLHNARLFLAHPEHKVRDLITEFILNDHNCGRWTSEMKNAWYSSSDRAWRLRTVCDSIITEREAYKCSVKIRFEITQAKFFLACGGGSESICREKLDYIEKVFAEFVERNSCRETLADICKQMDILRHELKWANKRIS